MIEFIFKWYHIPVLIVVTIFTIKDGLRRNFAFNKLLLYVILCDAGFYAGMIVAENILISSK